uniref:Uncharacterized protein n=1 Tax=Nothobranchius furzeri TaxID=105023 RepID=A0A8C6Q713_NOTFU
KLLVVELVLGCAESRCGLFMGVFSAAKRRCGNVSIRLNAFLRLLGPEQVVYSTRYKVNLVRSEVTFNNVAVNLIAVDDPHLFKESRLAALASAQQKDFNQFTDLPPKNTRASETVHVQLT